MREISSWGNFRGHADEMLMYTLFYAYVQWYYHKYSKVQPKHYWQVLLMSSVNFTLGSFFVVLTKSSEGFMKHNIAAMFWVVLYSEYWFYFSHRMCHWRPLYRWFHAQHHDFSQPCAITTLYCSPVEMLFVNLSSVFVPLWIVHEYIPLSRILIQAWVMVAILSSVHSHTFDDEKHTAHHKYRRVEFGFLGLLDRVLATDTDSIIIPESLHPGQAITHWRHYIINTITIVCFIQFFQRC